MSQSTAYHLFPKPCNTPALYLALTWVSGLLSGTVTAFSASGSGSVLIHSALISTPSFIALLSVMLLPFLWIGLASYLAWPALLFPAVFMKTFQFSYVASMAVSVYRTSRLLILILLLFTDILTLPLFWCCCSAAGATGLKPKHITICIILIAVFCGFDTCTISPFLAKLL